MKRKTLSALLIGALSGGALAALPHLLPGKSDQTSAASGAAPSLSERQRLERIVAESAAKSAADTARRIAQAQLQGRSGAASTPAGAQWQADAANVVSPRPKSR